MFVTDVVTYSSVGSDLSSVIASLGRQCPDLLISAGSFEDEVVLAGGEQLHVVEQNVRPGAAQPLPRMMEHVRAQAEVSEYERSGRAPEHNRPAN